MRQVNEQLAYSDERITRGDARVERLQSVPCVGPVTAAALVAALEVALGAVAPAVIFPVAPFRARPRALALGSALAGFGIVPNRLNVGRFALIPYTGTRYLPVWTETGISLFPSRSR